MWGLVLQLLRGGSGVLAAGALAKGVDFSTDHQGHEFVTYAAWYGVGATFVVVTVVLSIVIHRRHAVGESPEAPDDCQELLILLGRYANRLAQNLGNFGNWSPAVEDEQFEGQIPGYGFTTHEKAMELLLFKFAQFFSAAGVYQHFCLTHPKQGAVKPLVDAVCDALCMGSDKLRRIGKVSTNGWTGPEARPLDEDGFEAVLEERPEAFEPVKALLLEARPNTSARTRLEAAGRAARRTEKWLNENGYGL